MRYGGHDGWYGGYSSSFTGGTVPGATTFSGNVTFTGAITQSNATSISGGSRVIAQTAVAVTAPADTNENVLATVTIPANAMDANGAVRLRIVGGMNNNANAKTFRLRFSGASGTVIASNNVANAGGNIMYDLTIWNRNATNSQVIDWIGHVGGSPTSDPGSGITTSVDTTAETTIVFTAQKATAGDTMRFDSLTAEIIRP